MDSTSSSELLGIRGSTVLESKEWTGMGRVSITVSINKLGMAGQLGSPLKSSSSSHVTEINWWIECPSDCWWRWKLLKMKRSCLSPIGRGISAMFWSHKVTIEKTLVIPSSSKVAPKGLSIVFSNTMVTIWKKVFSAQWWLSVGGEWFCHSWKS